MSPDRRWREMLQSAMARHGWQVDATDAAGSPAVILYDADPWVSQKEATLRSVRAAYPQAKLVACVGFPRPDLAAALHRSGADEVWFKLAPLDELVGSMLP